MVPAFVIVLYSASSSLLWVSTVCHYMVVLVNGRFLRPPCQQSSRRTTYSQTLRRRARRQPSNGGQRMSFQHVGRYRYRYFVSHVLSISKGNNNPQTGCDSKGRGGFQLQYLAWTPLDDWVAWGKDFPTKVQRPDLVEEQVRMLPSNMTYRTYERICLLPYNYCLGSMSVMSSPGRQSWWRI